MQNIKLFLNNFSFLKSLSFSLASSYLTTYSSCVNTLFSPHINENNILLKVNVYHFTNTVNLNQYRLLLFHWWRKFPDSLEKCRNF